MHHMNIRISKLLLAIHKTKMENTVWFPYYCVNIKTFRNNLNVQINNLFTFRAFLSILAPIFSCLQLLLESGQWTWHSGVEYAILQWLVNGVYMLDCRSTHSAHLYQGCARLASHKEIGLKFFPQFQLDFHMKTDSGLAWVSNIR